ncbi:hypothetical protein DES53_104499 [Roseimicrobium gellanilyticum]|uniref:Uncharacterized protein n=1 Tax=Roseimicrobium gellanilyticum TaxID=748857 RepID=A0A366HPG6_9BACT|nr:hypothetical protein [Roseimicrobium gellanilyticum]RBP44676.1 hypothetical protein DES53_104499 [Roseimicrobium gellanilyticum]
MSDSSTSAKPGVIVCPVSPWFYRRMGLMALLLVGMGLYFIYDGRFGYPKSNKAAESKAWFEREVLGEYDAVVAEGPDAARAWVETARRRGWIIKAELEQPRWSDYAAPHGWAENPKMYTPEQIREQFYWGGAMIVGAAVVGIIVLLNHDKRFVGHADHMIMPNGRVVPFKDVYKIDKRKWDVKALAYVYYRETGEKVEHRAVIDDLKYDGAGRVLDRLMDQFKGELIEKVIEPEEESAETPAEQPTPPHGAA